LTVAYFSLSGNALGVGTGDRVRYIVFGGEVRLLPVRSIRRLLGAVNGMAKAYQVRQVHPGSRETGGHAGGRTHALVDRHRRVEA